MTDLGFWRKVSVGDGCWSWLASQNNTGYGRINRGRVQLAHRYAYELMVGPIPEGLVIDHLCRNRLCVRPDHLEPVTFQENCRRGERCGQGFCRRGHRWTTFWRQPSGEYKHACKKCRWQVIPPPDADWPGRAAA